MPFNRWKEGFAPCLPPSSPHTFFFGSLLFPPASKEIEKVHSDSKKKKKKKKENRKNMYGKDNKKGNTTK